MNLAKLSAKSGYKAYRQSRFTGYDCRKNASFGSLCQALNLSTEYAPLLSTAPGRRASSYAGVSAAVCGEDIYYIAENGEFHDLYCGTARVAQDFGYTADRILAFGGYIIAYPSGEYYKIPLSAGETAQTGFFRVAYTVDNPLSPFTVTADTVKVPRTLLGGSFSDKLHVGDEITVKLGQSGTPVSTVITALSDVTEAGVTYSVMQTAYEEWEAGQYNYGTFTHENPLCGFSVFFVHDNRLWGCHDRKIVCSKLGDPFNFNVFTDLSTGSWAWEMGENAPFTAGCSFNGYPTFFTESSVVRIFGSYPSQFTVRTQALHGVKAGCERSPATVGSYLYYYSPIGVMEYNGSTATLVSEALGSNTIRSAVGGSDGQGYFIVLDSGTAASPHVSLFVYRDGVWAQESVLPCREMLWADGTLHFLCGTASQKRVPSQDVSWVWEWNPIRLDTPNQKQTVRLVLRMQLRGTMKAEIRYDGGDYKTVGEYLSPDTEPLLVPLVPHRCNAYSLRLSGTGQATLYDLTAQTRIGSVIV